MRRRAFIRTAAGLFVPAILGRAAVPMSVSDPAFLGRKHAAAGGGGPPLTNLVAWWKADAIIGLSDGDPITTWPDSSGNSNDLTTQSATKPTYKTAIFGSQPIVRFASGNWMSMANSITFALNADLTMVIVSADAAADDQIICNATLNIQGFRRLRNGINNISHYWGTLDVISDTFTTSQADPVMATMTRSASTTTDFYENDISRGTKTCEASSFVVDAIGKVNGFPGTVMGDIAEMLIYNGTALSSGQVSSLFTDYLQPKYGL